MPFSRNPLKPLTKAEQSEIDRLDQDIVALWVDLGGKLCGCGKLATVTMRCVDCTVAM